ncbi:MAG: FtsW/RodA/SpoVE family cell cycle protein [Oscillospiraceae bacterium]|nr:FtsW/RodA/SpoVE family cell cycle protein [Oscillospiraceae bacterium]
MYNSRLKTAVKETNILLLIVGLLMSAYGIVAVMSATMWRNTDGQLFGREVRMMLIAVSVGILAGVFISFLDYEVLTRPWFIVAIVLFCIGIMLILFPLGKAPPERPDSPIWLKFGGFYFQPSELVKLGFIMSFSTHLSVVEEQINKPKQLAFLLAHGGLFIGLVAITGDMGSAFVFIAIFAGLLFMAGLRWYYFLAAILLLIAAMPVAWLKVFKTLHRERFIAVYPRFFETLGITISPERMGNVIYQQQIGVDAIASGGWLGRGLFNGDYTQTKAIPISESDMIFAVIGEELGFVGVAALFVLMGAIVIMCVAAARKSRDSVGKLICGGVALMLGVQTIINIGMCLKLLPCIGITLPFISAGGSANLCVWLAIGMVMSVSRFSQEHGPTKVRFITKVSRRGNF